MRKANKAIVAVSVLALLSLGGCASQSQLEEQKVQLSAIYMALLKIQENQAQYITLQKQQVALQEVSNNLKETSNGQVLNTQTNINRR